MQQAQTRLVSLDDLLSYFHESEKPPDRRLVGTEAEKFGLCEGGFPLSFDGDTGVSTLFDGLIERDGWEPIRELPNGPVIALHRDDTSITLEPGAQFELSGAPVRTIHETRAEFLAHLEEVKTVSQPCRVRWLGLGFHPFATRGELDWVPKLRYPVMRTYMPTRGPMALDMMLRTCTVQANFDYASEEDAMRKLRVSLRLQPIVTAMFANSPWLEKKDSGYHSYRALAWIHMDPDRSGLLPFAWKDQSSYRDYVEWALDAPMFLFKRESEVFYNTGQTFRAFMADGHAGHYPNTGDWITHLGMLFPEVRLKNTLEVRGADAQGMPTHCAVPALWKGILYDDESFRRAEALVDPFPYEEVERQRESLAKHGIRTKFLNREAADWAGEVLDLAEAGLRRIGALDPRGNDETIHLASLRALVETAKTPADDLLERVSPEEDFVERVMDLCSL